MSSDVEPFAKDDRLNGYRMEAGEDWVKKGLIVGVGVIAVFAALSLFLFMVSGDKVIVQ